MLNTDVLILGGGLAGLSTAYHLKKHDPKLRVLVLEKKERVGGLAGSLVQDGFTFDHTGHLLHLHDRYGKELILDLLKDNVHVLERSSWIYSHGAFTRYPFQANTFGLPAKVIEECVVGFLKAVRADLPNPPSPIGRGQGEGYATRSLTFRDWTLRTFGAGIAKHFMFPYNEKLWKVPLDRMTTEWVAPFVPRPKVEEVLYGALTDQKKFFGYNATFRYPLRGGVQSLPDALAQRALAAGVLIETGCPVARLDLREKVVEAANLGEIRYERLVNTLPLSGFLDLAAALPAPVKAARRGLSWTTVHCLNLGIRRPSVSDKHWIYFPERRFPFYRAGVSSNFSPHVAPRGTSSFYIELSSRPGERFSREAMEPKVMEGLRACGLLKASDRIATRLWVTIPIAYVTYDRHRARALPRLFAWLKKRGVESIGRYGAWKYSFMEEAILDGKRCAERILGIAPREPAHPAKPQEELKPLK